MNEKEQLQAAVDMEQQIMGREVKLIDHSWLSAGTVLAKRKRESGTVMVPEQLHLLSLTYETKPIKVPGDRDEWMEETRWATYTTQGTEKPCPKSSGIVLSRIVPKQSLVWEVGLDV